MEPTRFVTLATSQGGYHESVYESCYGTYMKIQVKKKVLTVAVYLFDEHGVFRSYRPSTGEQIYAYSKKLFLLESSSLERTL